MDEAFAIARLKEGDIDGLAALVRLHQVRALRAAYLVTRDRALAEDVVQAAFLRAYQRIAQFDATRPFGPWFLRSVVNAAVQATGQRARVVPLEPADADERGATGATLPDNGPGPDLHWEAVETREELWAALGQLTPRQREAVVLRYYLNLDESEMARQLDCPPGTVKSRLSAARARLRSLLRPSIRQEELTP
jgi:RNA polymerase sigma-70 factor (ECF subfamily)